MRILDLDLDFFLNDVVPCDSRSGRRLSCGVKPWDPADVRRFLEENCGLAATSPMRAHVIEHHDDLFGLVRAGSIPAPISIVHVDSHADLGFGEVSWFTLMTEVLAVAPEQRAEMIENRRLLTPGNVLLMCVACRWIEELTYVPNPREGYDIYDFLLTDLNCESGDIQLRRCATDHLDDITSLSKATRLAWLSGLPPEWVEPKVPLKRVWPDAYKNDREFDVVVLSRSPGCTPPESDVITTVIEEYLLVS